ncbi:hypothetical protein BDZ88DRAFT_488957 [Geranomyces variabilis]|nr:hypothetical protein BDZ88DRAFT_488957 [Geranomyces variabilis]
MRMKGYRGQAFGRKVGKRKAIPDGVSVLGQRVRTLLAVKVGQCSIGRNPTSKDSAMGYRAVPVYGLAAAVADHNGFYLRKQNASTARWCGEYAEGNFNSARRRFYPYRVLDANANVFVPLTLGSTFGADAHEQPVKRFRYRSKIERRSGLMSFSVHQPSRLLPTATLTRPRRCPRQPESPNQKRHLFPGELCTNLRSIDHPKR